MIKRVAIYNGELDVPGFDGEPGLSYKLAPLDDAPFIKEFRGDGNREGNKLTIWKGVACAARELPVSSGRTVDLKTRSKERLVAAKKIKFPTIDEVAKGLVEINRMSLPKEDADDGIDVRLQVKESGSWDIRFGSSDYDQDHRGFWGSSGVPGNNRRFRSREVAKDLIEQAKDDYASNQP
jgi:hypothetical protein